MQCEVPAAQNSRPRDTCSQDIVDMYLSPIMNVRFENHRRSWDVERIRGRLEKRRALIYGAPPKASSGVIGYRGLDVSIQWLDAKSIRCKVVHEAAIACWNLDINLFLPIVDVVVDRAGYRKLRLISKKVHGCARYRMLDIGGVKVRICDAIDEYLYDEIPSIHCDKYNCEVADRYFVLEHLTSSPDMRLLLEQRARLAEVLYWDKLSDEHLSLFMRYVRGD